MPETCRGVLLRNKIKVHYTTNCNTQSSAPEDGQNIFPKHAELTGIISKPLLLHLVDLSIIFISMMRGQANIR